MKRIAIALVLVAASAVAAVPPDERCVARADVTGLPLVELPSKHAGDRFAVMLSGDGGWRRIDQRVTDRLRAAGIPVVGFLTPDYYRTRRDPAEAACALERVIRVHKLQWKRDKVLLIGYSRGADILPFLASRLPADLRQSVVSISLLGLEPLIDFKYTPSWLDLWNNRAKEKQYAVRPELEKLRGHRILCFYGQKEKDSLCRALEPSLAMVVPERGGHHFAGNYKGIAETILDAAK